MNGRVEQLKSNIIRYNHYSKGHKNEQQRRRLKNNEGGGGCFIEERQGKAVRGGDI